MNKGAWWATVHGIAQNQKGLNTLDKKNKSYEVSWYALDYIVATWRKRKCISQPSNISFIYIL